MRAVVHDRYGPPEVLRVEEVADPVRLFTGIRRPRRKILRTEFDGEVAALGPGVRESSRSTSART